MQITTNEIIRKSLIYKYWKEGIKILTASQLPVMERINDLHIDDLKNRMVNIINKKPIELYLKSIWVQTGTYYAYSTGEKIKDHRKSLSDEFEMKINWRPFIDENETVNYIPLNSGRTFLYPEEKLWQDYFVMYSNERARKILKTIMDSQTEKMNDIIDSVIAESTSRGLSVIDTQKLLQEKLIDTMSAVNRYQAARIARTEVIGASNKGSFDSASQSGLCTGKEWATSGLPGIRESHLFYESLGEVAMDYEYAPGLQYPGDPNGSAEEIINCRCTHLLNVD